MVILGRIKRWGRRDLGHDWLLKTAALVEGRLSLLGGGLLLRRVIKNYGPILVANIRPLAIQRGRIVIRPEDVEQLIVTDDRWIELYLHHFGVPGIVAAYIFVGRILLRAARVPDRCIRHTARRAEGGFHSPETTRTKSRFLHLSHHEARKLRVQPAAPLEMREHSQVDAKAVEAVIFLGQIAVGKMLVQHASGYAPARITIVAHPGAEQIRKHQILLL